LIIIAVLGTLTKYIRLTLVELAFQLYEAEMLTCGEPLNFHPKCRISKIAVILPIRRLCTGSIEFHLSQKNHSSEIKQFLR
jgi:hypothetical protein